MTPPGENTPHPDTTPVSIRWARSAKEIPASLWEQCFPPPLEGLWWYLSLEGSGLEDQFTFSYAVIMRDGVSIGIAPVFVMDVPLSIVAPPLVTHIMKALSIVSPGLMFQRTLFVGSPCADEGTVGLVPDENIRTVIPALQRELDTRARRVKASMIVWKDLPEAAARDAGPPLLECGLFGMVSYPGTRLALNANSFESYLRTLGSNQRYQLKKKLRRSRDMGLLEETVIQSPDNGLLREIFSLFRQTYERSTTKFERLTPEFFRLISSYHGSHFILLRNAASGKPVAFMLCFVIGKRVINKFIGIDYAYGGNWYLYFRLWEAAVRWTLTAGAEEIQSGQTGYRAKYDVGHKLVPLTNYCKHVSPVVHRVFKAIARFISRSTLDDDLKQLENVLKKAGV